MLFCFILKWYRMYLSTFFFFSLIYFKSAYNLVFIYNDRLFIYSFIIFIYFICGIVLSYVKKVISFCFFLMLTVMSCK